MSKSICYALVTSLLAMLVGCADTTSVRLEITVAPGVSVDGLVVTTGVQRREMGMLDSVQLLVPDGWAGSAHRFEVEGTQQGLVVAAGAAVVTPIAGAEVTARVTLVDASCEQVCNLDDVTCDGDAVATCELDAVTGCPAWSAPVACPASAPFCSNGTCSEMCSDECTAGATRCAGSGGEQVCGQSDSDSCSDWGAITACGSGEVCDAESCVAAYDLTVVKSGPGTVTSSPAGITCGATCTARYVEGTVITLTATPDAGQTFVGWSGGGCSGTGTCVVTLGAATEVRATFRPPCTEEKVQLQQGSGARAPSLALDPSGRLHALDNYFEPLVSSPDPYYFTRPPGGVWSQAAGIDLLGSSFRLAVDGAGGVHLSYDALNTGTQYAYRAAGGTSFSATTVSSGGSTGIAVDAMGGVHIARSDCGYSYRGSVGNFTTEYMSVGKGAAAMAIAGGYVHIVCNSRSGTSELVYLRRPIGSTGTWAQVTIGGNELGDPTYAVAVDEAGGVHIAIASYQNGYFLAYGYKAPAASSFSMGYFPSEPAVGRPSIAARAGVVHIVYVWDHGAGGSQYHIYAPYGVKDWTQDVIDSSGGDSAVIVDQAGVVHIVYTSPFSDSGGLWYARRCP